MSRASRRSAPAVWRVVAVLLLALADDGRAATERTATTARDLADANRLFRGGDLDAAREVYLRSWQASGPDPLLAYNLGVTAHQSGRLPEAVLWYRRALAAGGDPSGWVGENLEAARTALGTTRTRPRGALAWIAAHRVALLAVAAVLSWTGLVALALAPPRVAGGLGAVALLLVVAVLGAGRFGPRAAVLMVPCGGVTAGSEVWAQRIDGGWKFAGEDGGALCPVESVEPVEPP